MEFQVALNAKKFSFATFHILCAHRKWNWYEAHTTTYQFINAGAGFVKKEATEENSSLCMERCHCYCFQTDKID